MDLSKLERASSDQQKIEQASPKVDELKSTFGEESYSESNGEWKVKITDERLTPEENRRRWEAFGSMMENRRRLQTEMSLRDSEERDTVSVWDEKNRTMREVPAEMENAVSRKEWARNRITGRRKRIVSESEIRRRMASGDPAEEERRKRKVW